MSGAAHPQGSLVDAHDELIRLGDGGPVPEGAQIVAYRRFEELARLQPDAPAVVTHDESRVLGCVYVYPDADADARLRLWVRREAHELDPTLEHVVREWIARDWPFTRVAWPGREPA